MQYSTFYAVDEKGNEYSLSAQHVNGSIFLNLKKETFMTCKQLRVLGKLSTAKAGDDGYYIIPRKINNLGDIRTNFLPREDTTLTQINPVMSWMGVKKQDCVYIVRVDRNYRFGFEIKVENGIYSACVLYDFTTHDKVYDDIRLEIIPLPLTSTYADMAKMEREIRLSRFEISTLKEKCKRPCVEYARKYPLIRIRMGWKPSPSPILFQTEETEPEMEVKVDFKRVREIADELKRQGVKGAELQLVGWHRGGHDGRFPQIFPADPRFGGNEEMQKTFDYVKSLGFRISTHTNSIDTTTIADCFDWNDIALKRDGSHTQIGHYSGGLAYHVCPIKQYHNTLRDMPKLASFNENGLHFTDVISIVVPDYCSSPLHPSSTQNGIIYAQKEIEYLASLFGGFSSEGAMDFALKHLDYALYATMGNTFNPAPVPLCDEILPIFELVYHGILLYNPIATTINYTTQSAKDKLIFIMRGGKPSMYFYSKFRTGGAKNWMGDGDLTCENDEALSRSINYVKQAQDEYEKLADLQFEYMSDYKILPNGIHETYYANGVKIIGNFNDTPITYNDMTLNAYSYLVL